VRGANFLEMCEREENMRKDRVGGHGSYRGTI
jgi:hypothetical protein